MIQVTAVVNDEELQIDFNNVKSEGKSYWEGTSPNLTSKIVIGETENGFDEAAIVMPKEISTHKAILFERFLNAYNEYREEISAGFESSNENKDGMPSSQKPYDPDDIKVRREGFSVFEVNRMMTEQNDIDLNPDFQRNLVWENSRKSALIESILLGIPIPVFYFAESKSGKYHVVDGLQRLSTIKQFFNNEFYLKNLEHLKDCEGRYYKLDEGKAKTKEKVLERRHTRRLENAQFQVNVIESASPSKVKYDIFKRINTGGRPLNHQEVRNCIAEDHVRNFLKKLAHSDEFEKATGKSISDYRMDGQELVLRFAGFKMEQDNLLAYSGDMNSFLDEVLDLANDMAKPKLEAIAQEFLKSMRINYHLFGQYCFRKSLSEHLKPNARKQTINKALFVSWSIEVLDLDEETIKSLIPFGSFAEKLAKELDNKGKYYTILTTGTSDKQNLKDASDFARKLIVKNLVK